MAATRRTQLLMDPGEYRQLRAVARKQRISVAELIRSAVRQSYLAPPPDRQRLVEAILALKLPKMNWKKLKREIEAAHAGLS